MEVVDLMSEAYPDLAGRKSFIDKVIANEEERFLKTLDRGLSLLDEIMARVKEEGGREIPGEDAFMLYDTFGFPVDLTEDIARREGLGVDSVGFEAQMELQREKASTSSAFSEAGGEGEDLESSLGGAGVRFVGYDTFEASARIVEIQEKTDQGYVSCPELAQGRTGRLITDVTPFYGESGGQVGDTGTITSDGASARVVDTSKTESGIIIHLGKSPRAASRKGSQSPCRLTAAGAGAS